MDWLDWRSIVLAKHAQHVVLIHFPIALFIIGVTFDVLSQRLRQPELSAVAYYNLLAAAVFTIPSVLTGIIAWQWLLEGHKLKGNLLYHLVFGLGSATMILWTWWIHFRARRNGNSLPVWRMFPEVFGLMALIITGHLGGFVSGVNGAP
jgi:uncharacterized membrane protein